MHAPLEQPHSGVSPVQGYPDEHAYGLLRPASAGAADAQGLRPALLRPPAGAPDAGHSRDSAASEQHTVPMLAEMRSALLCMQAWRHYGA